MVDAKDCKCEDCGKQAVAFWPMIDPDIPSLPYCRSCLDIRKARTTEKLLKIMAKNDFDRFMSKPNNKKLMDKLGNGKNGK